MTNKNLTIGFAGLINYRSLIGQNIVFGINSAAKDFNINLINFISTFRYSVKEDYESILHFKKKLEYLNKENIDGLITWSSSFQFFMKLNEIGDYHRNLIKLPAVTIGYPIEGLPSILIDHYSGIKSLMTHLINVHKYTKIAFIGTKFNYSYEERFDAYKKILKENNLSYDPDLVYLTNDVDNNLEIKEAIETFFNKRKLKCKKDIEAFITVNDLIAQNLIEELHNLGISTPDEVAIVGFNNQFSSIRSYPPITTIDPDFFQIGYQSVVTLLSKINGNKRVENFLMPCKLVIRQSCGCYENFINKPEKAKNGNNEKKAFDEVLKICQEEIILRIKDTIAAFNKNFNSQHSKELLDNFLNDSMSNTSFRFLNSLKQLFVDSKNVTEEKLIIWQNVISELRNILLPYCLDYGDISFRAENIFHQARVMVDAAYTYLSFSKKSDVYKTGALVRIATDFNSAEDLEQIIKLIKIYLNELEISGIIFSLYEDPHKDIGKSRLVFVYNKEADAVYSEDSKLFPARTIDTKTVLPGGERRISMIFEILYYNEIYLGYVIFEMDTASLPIYDTLRTILNPALYRAVIINKRTELGKDKKLLLKNLKIIKDKLALESFDKNYSKDDFNINTVLEYLINQISLPTDLEKIAKDFNLSVSTIARRTKKLTGYSIQKLHELLKTEKAKLLLEDKNNSMSRIAELLGYKNQYYFSSVFKKCAGMSPKKWIKLKKNS